MMAMTYALIETERIKRLLDSLTRRWSFDLIHGSNGSVFPVRRIDLSV